MQKLPVFAWERPSRGLAPLFVLAVFCLSAAVVPVMAGTFTAYGPQNYVRESGPPVTVTQTFSVLNPSTAFTLKIYNGGMEDNQFEMVSSSIITINGVQVVGPSEFNQNVAYIEKNVSLQAVNEISVQLRGKPGGGITVVIVGTDNVPPTITASAAPPANANGWNNSDVTVSFSCADTISGVASCPLPVVVATEGANQTVERSAVDNAGNSASASVVVNVDKTAPSVSVTAPFNGETFTVPEISVTGTASDALSGNRDGAVQFGSGFPFGLVLHVQSDAGGGSEHNRGAGHRPRRECCFCEPLGYLELCAAAAAAHGGGRDAECHDAAGGGRTRADGGGRTRPAAQRDFLVGVAFRHRGSDNLGRPLES